MAVINLIIIIIISIIIIIVIIHYRHHHHHHRRMMYDTRTHTYKHTCDQEMDEYKTAKKLYAPYCSATSAMATPDDTEFCKKVFDRMCATRYEAHFMMVHKKALGKPSLATKKREKVVELNTWIGEKKGDVRVVLNSIREAAGAIIKS